jgi:hypothetical protein
MQRKNQANKQKKGALARLELQGTMLRERALQQLELDVSDEASDAGEDAARDQQEEADKRKRRLSVSSASTSSRSKKADTSLLAINDYGESRFKSDLARAQEETKRVKYQADMQKEVEMQRLEAEKSAREADRAVRLRELELRERQLAMQEAQAKQQTEMMQAMLSMLMELRKPQN